VRVRVLGSAAGGGYPQWNCRCRVCEAARAGESRPRTQSSLAIRGDDGPWFLVNASPDLRQQLETLERPDGVRAPPVAGVLLTDAEIDHTAGLLLMRESATPIPVYGDAGIKGALSETLLRMLQRFSGVDWRALPLEGSSLVVEPFEVSDRQTGFAFRDSGGTVTYVPGLSRLDDDVVDRLAASDVVLVDGTFWQDDDLARLGISDRTARDMGHVPLTEGTLAMLAGLEQSRKILVHINNTNPILLEDSPERAEVVRAGVEVAYDGLEVEL
jgi:pyrroloquinoline quinone biosynthesis protein B